MERQEDNSRSADDLYSSSSTFDQGGREQPNQFGHTATATHTIATVFVANSATPTNSGNSNNENTNNGNPSPAVTASALPTSQLNNQQDGDNQQHGNNQQGNYNHNNHNSNNNNANHRNGDESNNDNSRSNDRQSDNGSGLSSDSKQAVVISVTSSIGGVIILAILLYIFWRRRRGATYSEIARFRPHSESTSLNPLQHQDRLTALPIYRDQRVSIRSSPCDSVTNFSGRTNRRGPPPPPLQSPLAPNTRKSTLPTKIPSPESDHVGQAATSVEVDKPEMSINRISDTAMSLSPNSDHTRSLSHHVSQKSLRSNRSGEWALKDALSPDDTQDPERWSWTNSQAPPTPRIVAPNARASLQSYRSHSLAAWVRGQSAREELTTPPPEQNSGGKTILKNQASVPKLASPPRAKKPHKNHGRVSSLSTLLKPHKDHPSPPRIPSSRLKPRMGVATTTTEMVQKNRTSSTSGTMAAGF